MYQSAVGARRGKSVAGIRSLLSVVVFAAFACGGSHSQTPGGDAAADSSGDSTVPVDSWTFVASAPQYTCAISGDLTPRAA